MLDIIRANAQSWGVKVAFGIIIIVFVFWGVGGLTGGPATVVVTVNDQPITQQEFARQMMDAERNLRSQLPDLTPEQLKSLGLRRRVLQDMIITSILTQEANRIGLSVTPVELRRRVESFPFFRGADGKFSPERYIELLTAQGMTAGQFETTLSKELLLEKLQQDVTAGAYVSPEQARDMFVHDGERRVIEYLLFPDADFAERASIAPDAAQAYYESHQDEFRAPAQAELETLTFSPESLAAAFPATPAQVEEAYEKEKDRYAEEEQLRARHIILLLPQNASPEEEAKVKAEIEALHARIAGGEDFADVAAKHSQDGTAAQGGDLGWFTREQMVAPFADAAFALQEGALSGPVRTDFGYHLIKSEEKRAARQKTFDEVKDEIAARISQTQASGKVQDALDESLAMLRGKTLAEVGAPFKLKPETTGLEDTSSLTTELGLRPEDMQRILAAKPGTPLDTPFVTPKGYLIVNVVKSEPEHVQPFAAVKAEIETRLKNEEARRLATADAEKALKNLPALPQRDGKPATLVRSEAMTRDGQLPGLGQSAALGTQAFGAEAGDWLPAVYPLESGVLLAKVSEVLRPDEEAWKKVADQVTEALQQAKREELFQAFVQTLQARAKVALKDETILTE